ncbi:6-phosphogluconolactonase [Candidatus Vampirococcus lugosii]|uniref:6-phosphogluconolactonase n=1 Tax=Candidatus Vampirococcus lugosii TaxID=2789015 RepID=A0ABS5QNE0_9BACT|nr:6-phosphogluconolactonase [Candidatus Vampirococcus lugosii]MBS8122181.1 6-phosphogluconolactonase [Candidatus Vampirococcus lugosii]
MNFFSESNIQELQEMFWKNFEKSLLDLKNNEHIYIGLSGGTSLNYFYEKILKNFKNIEFEIRKKIIFVFVDERIVSLNHKDSNYKQIKDFFLGKLIDQNLINQDQIISINYDIENIADDYFSKVPYIDISLIGVGEDGHIASLFPKHILLQSKEKKYLSINDSPKKPSHRITISPEMIKDIKYGFIFFMGDAKQKALNNFFDNNLIYKDCPAKLINNTKNVFLFTDLKL